MIRIGVVGAGVIGQLRAQTIHQHPQTELVGVADPDIDRARSAVATSGGQAFSEWEQLLKCDGLEAIVVSSPVQFHEEAVIGALQAGLHVLCEKPLANSVEACRRMLAAARESGQILAVGFNHRYYPAVSYVRSVIAEGRIGTLDHLRVFGGHDGLANFRADWQYQGALSGGGAMMDVGIHMTDLAYHLLGDITEVYGISSGRVWNVPGSEDNAMALFKSSSGVSAIYQATWTEWKGYRFWIEAYGDRGMVRGYYAPMFNLLVTSDRPGGRRKRMMKFYPEIILREKLKSWTSTALQSFQEELKDLLRLIAGNQDVVLADGIAGLRAVEVAHAVYQSTQEGQPIQIRDPF